MIQLSTKWKVKYLSFFEIIYWWHSKRNGKFKNQLNLIYNLFIDLNIQFKITAGGSNIVILLYLTLKKKKKTMKMTLIKYLNAFYCHHIWLLWDYAQYSFNRGKYNLKLPYKYPKVILKNRSLSPRTDSFNRCFYCFKFTHIHIGYVWIMNVNQNLYN